MSAIKLFYTGGTFLSSNNGNNREVTDTASKMNQKKTQNTIEELGYTLDGAELYNIDSSDVKPSHRIHIANTIHTLENKKHDYDGYVIIHGTDTMEYTASALSLLLKGIDKSIVITGSMQSIQEELSDAPNNLISAYKGIQKLSELKKNGIYIAFGDKLLQGNKSKKVDTSAYDAFDTPGYPIIGSFDGTLENKNIALNEKQLSKYTTSLDKEGVDITKNKMTDQVALIKLYPGIQLGNIKNLYGEGLKGIVLEGYGDGNVPTDKDFLAVIKNLISQGIFVVVKSQCLKGKCDHKYEGAQKIFDIDKNFVISAKNMTTASTLTKLMRTLENNNNEGNIKKAMEEDIAGELL